MCPELWEPTRGGKAQQQEALPALEVKEGSRQAGNVMRAGARRNKNPCQHTSPSGAMQV